MDIMDMSLNFSYEAAEPVRERIEAPDHRVTRNASGALTGQSPSLSLAKPRRKWPVSTHHSHLQLRSLLHFSPDAKFLYFVASESEQRPTPGRFFIYGGGHKVIAKLRLSTSEVTMLKATQCYAIHCFSVKYGFIAYCTTSGFSVYHEESDTIVHSEERLFRGSSQPNNLVLKEVFGRVLVVIMCNGGQNPIYEILPNEDSDNNTEKEPLGEDKGDEDDTMEVDGQTPKKRAAFRLVPFETVESPHSLNYAAFGEGPYYNTMLAAPDACVSPVFFEINEGSKMVLSNVRIPFAPPLPAQQEQREVYANVLAGLEVAVPNIGDRILQPFENSALYDSMMAAWWGSTGICALALEQGYCVVLDYEKRQTLAMISNADATVVNSPFAPNGHIRVVSFAPEQPVLLFAESKLNLHLVDLRTWERQILRAPPRDRKFNKKRREERRRHRYAGFPFMDRFLPGLARNGVDGMADVPALGAQHPEEVNFLQNWLGEGNDEQDWNGNGEEGLNIVGEPEYIVPEQVVHGEVQEVAGGDVEADALREVEEDRNIEAWADRIFEIAQARIRDHDHDGHNVPPAYDRIDQEVDARFGLDARFEHSDSNSDSNSDRFDYPSDSDDNEESEDEVNEEDFLNLDINGLTWLPGSNRFYVAYAHCIQEYELTYGVPTLSQIATDVIVRNREKWEEFGWSESIMPQSVKDELLR